MEQYKFLIIILLIGLSGCQDEISSEPVLLKNVTKEWLKRDGPAEFFYWEIDYKESLWQFDLPDCHDLKAYRDSLKVVLGQETYEAAIKKEASQSLSKENLENEENGDRINAMLVHTGTIGKIRKINSLEAQILNYQISRFPLLSHPTEFHGFMMSHEAQQKMRIYLASSDTPWPPKPNVIIEAIEEDMKAGWKLKYHLHNHYEDPSTNYIGILAPSLADAHYYKMLAERFNVDKALITNGFHTVELDKSEFERFESH